MRVSMDIELKDTPGQLLLALQPISEMGGNIQSVVHCHDKRTPRGTVPIHVVFEVAKEGLMEIIRRIKANGVIVARVDERRLHEQTFVMLIGHIVHTDISETIDAVDSTGHSEIVDLTLSMPDVKRVSSAFMVIAADSEDSLALALNVLRATAEDKGLLVIEPIKDDAIWM